MVSSCRILLRDEYDGCGRLYPLSARVTDRLTSKILSCPSRSDVLAPLSLSPNSFIFSRFSRLIMNHPHSTNPAAALAALFPGHPATALSNVQIQLQPETAPSLHQAQSLQQWPLQFPSMTVPLHPPPLQQPVVAVQNLAALATALQPYMNAATQSATPVGLVANDEEILVKALKDARAQGLTPRQALERLHGVSIMSGLCHASGDWGPDG